MAQINSRDMVLLGLQTSTTNGTTADINLPQGFTSAIVILDVQTVSGTSPTLDVKVQNKLPLAAAADATGNFPTTTFYDDLLAFAQCTTTSTRRVFRIGAGGNNVEAVATSGTLTAASARNGPLGALWRLNFTIGGSATPTFAFSATAQFLP